MVCWCPALSSELYWEEFGSSRQTPGVSLEETFGVWSLIAQGEELPALFERPPHRRAAERASIFVGGGARAVFIYVTNTSKMINFK